jgi:hypothetical protein
MFFFVRFVKFDSLVPTRSVAGATYISRAKYILFADGLLHSRSVGLSAFAAANPFRNFPSCSNPNRLQM